MVRWIHDHELLAESFEVLESWKAFCYWELWNLRMQFLTVERCKQDEPTNSDCSKYKVNNKSYSSKLKMQLREWRQVKRASLLGNSRKPRLKASKVICLWRGSCSRPHPTVIKCIPPYELQRSILEALYFWKTMVNECNIVQIELRLCGCS